MNYRVIFNTLGRIIILGAVLMLLPLFVSLIYLELKSALAFGIVIVISLILGFTLLLCFKRVGNNLFAKEGFFIVSSAWLSLSFLGALPFVISGDIPNYIDALFETISGFTTTGATIITEFDKISHGMLMWRSFTHWIGGMGILVMLTALIPATTERSIHILKAEMPGPQFGKLRPKLKDTAKILYLIYIVMTVTQIIMLLFGGMPLFESVVHTFGTAGTGGFGVFGDSIASYSPYCQWVIAIFMFLYGINFIIYYLILIGRIKEAVKSKELIVYFSIISVSTLIITINILSIYPNFGDALRQAFFQVISIATTTGYATADTNLWPGLSKGILFILMFVGACAGSTAGGLKVTRVIILVETAKKNIKRVFRPRIIKNIKIDGKTLETNVVHETNAYFVIYFLILITGFLVLSMFNPEKGIEINLTATLSCLSNVGPYFGSSIPYDGYASFHVVSKIILAFTMLLGRLELYPMLFFVSPYVWRNKN